jgi:hypothetical protein
MRGKQTPRKTLAGPVADWLREHEHASKIIVCEHGDRFDKRDPWILWYREDSPLPSHLPMCFLLRWHIKANLSWRIVPIAEPQAQGELF